VPETPFGQKAQARAEQMHSEIESIVKKHDQVRQQEAKKLTKFAGFVGEWSRLIQSFEFWWLLLKRRC
jgi:hypothetical protein